MPKNNVYSDDADIVVEVRWGKDGHVQVGVTHQSEAPPPDGSTWWATLERPACNALIRAVRVARDGAYGTDA